MATVTAPKLDREESRRRVVHPLERLRGRIRAYVVVEGLLVVGLYLALWFWIGLLLDYGIFRLFAVDWVQTLPWIGPRATLLAVLTAGLVAVVALKVFLRLFREFRDDALALVLERRYPDVLGDRLITAVELADPAKARRNGYSQAMIEHTVRDAAERLDRVPIAPVFDYGRLWRQGLVVAAVSLGVYLLVAGAARLRSGIGLGEFSARFLTVAEIWFERNVLMIDTIWPRRCHLEFVNFPASGDLRVGRNSPPPTLRVRALKWVVADSRAPEGWRALTWADLSDGAFDVGPLPELPGEWRQWRMNQLEQELDKPETPERLGADTHLAVREVFRRLDELAARPALARRLRQLEVPPTVEVLYQGATIRSEQKLQNQGDQEYSGALSDLRESVTFRVRAEDYATTPRSITLVPPPGLSELVRDEYRPAYLYHRAPAGADPAVLKGKKHVFQDLPVSLSGNASRIDVPLGTRLVLRAKTDKRLAARDGVRLKASAAGVTLTQPNDDSFQVTCENVTTPLDLTLEFTDTDGVLGQRQVIVRPLDDLPPDVDVQVEVVRRTSQGYLVTPVARIPLSGKVRDDHGLERVEYAYQLAAVNAPTGAGPAPVVSALQATPAGITTNLLNAAYLVWVGKLLNTVAQEKPPETLPVAAFVRRLKETTEDYALATLEKRLVEKPTATLLLDHVLDPAEAVFDVERLKLKVGDDKAVQPHYRLRLWLTAADNNVETGPGVGRSKEQFNFLIVSENELIVEIAKEEEGLHLKLEEAVNRLKEGRGKLDQIVQELPKLRPDEFSPMARRAEEIAEAVLKSGDVSRDVHNDYRRILRELEVNQVQPGIISRVRNNICDPLEATLGREFVAADERMRELQKALDERKATSEQAGPAREALDRLIDRLSRVLDAMGDVTTINKLIATLVEIEKGEQRELKRLEELRDRIQERILEEALNPKKP
jgi:hypothetical protein